MADAAPRSDLVAQLRHPTSAWWFGETLNPHALFGVAAILGYAFVHLTLIRYGIAVSGHHMPVALPFLFLIAVVAASLTARFRMATLPAMVRVFMSGLAMLAVIYAVSEPFDFPLPNEAVAPWLTYYLPASRAVAILCGLVALSRPAFLLPALLYGAIGRALMIAFTGVQVSNTDLMNVLEAGLFASSIGLSIPLILWLMQRNQKSEPSGDWIGIGTKLVIAAAIGGHLGSYFHSGIAKLTLDGGPFSWLLDNHTQDGVLIGLERGTAPFAAWPGMTQQIYDMASLNPAVGNIFVVVAQLAAIFAMFRRQLLMGLTLLYDVFHVGVYLIYGLLFWKWVLLNFVIFGTFARCRERFTPAFIAVGVLMTAFGSFAMWTARLAWYDSANMQSTFVEAETAEGQRVRVPSAAFGTMSYPFSHGVLFIPPNQRGHFPGLLWGTYRSYAPMVTSRGCEVPAGYIPRPEGKGELSNLAHLVQARHGQLVDRADAEGHVGYHLYPHHHYPSPFTHIGYDDLDLRSVTRYRWVVESVCLSLEKGQLQRQVIKRDEYDLGPVQPR